VGLSWNNQCWLGLHWDWTLIDTKELWEYMLKFWEVPVRGKSEPTFDHLHMSRNKGRESIDREEGIKEEVHIGIDGDV
jgi:hypothetical protein